MPVAAGGRFMTDLASVSAPPLRYEGLALAHLWVAFAAFVGAAVLGFWQMWVRSPLPAPFETPSNYFISLTAHGSTMAYVVTTFFAMGFGYTIAATALERPLAGRIWAWVGFAVALAGSVMMLVPVFAGIASVLYTFYPPLLASAWFYIGFLLLIAGSWAWATIMIVQMRLWKREHPGQPVPFAMFAIVATAILWLWTDAGVASEVAFQILPLSFGWKDQIDPGLARTLYSLTFHAITYFWLLPAYIAFYVFVPAAAGGRLYSDLLGRVVFILFLVFSLPTGMHHMLVDPELPSGFKFLQSLLTAMIVAPTLITIFTIGASMEIAGRMHGGRGLFGWLVALPRDKPMVLAFELSIVMLGLGGFGGLVNMSYAMNAMIHNTAWVTAHFHLILGGATIIMYFAIGYEIWPALTGRQLGSVRLVRAQLWLWFAGVMITTIPWHITGILGEPRRVALFDYSNPTEAQWGPLTIVSVFGAGLMLAGAILFLVNLLLPGARVADRGIRYAVALNPPDNLPRPLNGFAAWNVVLLVAVILAYAVPIAHYWIPGGGEAVASGPPPTR